MTNKLQKFRIYGSSGVTNYNSNNTFGNRLYNNPYSSMQSQNFFSTPMNSFGNSAKLKTFTPKPKPVMPAPSPAKRMTTGTSGRSIFGDTFKRQQAIKPKMGTNHSKKYM
jgi:hypothetical protein